MKIDPANIGEEPISVYFRLTREISNEDTLEGEIGYVYSAELFRGGRYSSSPGTLTYYSYPYAWDGGWFIVGRPCCDLEKADLCSTFDEVAE